MISILVILGILSRFFLGLETYGQLLFGITVALVYIGLAMFDDFWDNQFGNIFNSESSSCLKRWLAFLIGFGGVLDLAASYFLAIDTVANFEQKKGNNYIKYQCKTECIDTASGPYYLSYRSVVELAWWSYLLMMFIYFAVTSSVKYSNNQLNLIKYASQFKSPKNMAIKLFLYLLVNMPLIVACCVSLNPWLSDFFFKLGMSLLWVILYRWVFPVIKKKMDIYIGSDMFAPWMNNNDEEKKGLI